MRRRARKILRALVRVVLGLALLLVALWLLRVPLFGGLVKRAVVRRLEAELGGRYEIDGVGGTWLSDLRLEGLRTVEPPPTGPLVGVAADRIEVHYDLLGLLGDQPLAAVEEVEVAGGRVDLDVERPAAGGGGEAPDLGDLDAFRGSLDVDLDVTVATGQGAVALRGLAARLGPGRPLELAIDEVVLPDRLDVRGPLAGRVTRVDADTWRFTSESRLGGVLLTEATIHRRGRVEAVLEVAGGRVAAGAGSGRVEADLVGLDLARLPDFVVALLPEDVPEPTAGRLDGSVALVFGADGVETTFDLVVVTLVWRGERIERIAARGTYVGGEVRLAEADVRGEGVRATGLDVRLDPDLTFPLRTARSLSVEVENLRSFAPDLGRDVALALEASSSEPRRLVVESMLVRDAAGSLGARGEVRTPEDPERWREVEVDLSLSGEVVDPAALALPWTGRLRVEGRASGPLGALALDVSAAGEEVAVEGRPVEGARLAGTLSWPDIDVSALSIRAPGLEVDASGRAALAPLTFDGATWRLEAAALERVAPLLPSGLPSLGGRARSTGRLSWDGKVLAGTAEVSVRGLVVDGETIGDVEASLAGGADGWVHVETLALERDGKRVAALAAPLEVAWDGDGIRLAGADVEIGTARLRLEASVRPRAGRAEIGRLDVALPSTRLRLIEPLTLAWKDAAVSVPSLAVSIDEEIEVRAALEGRVDGDTATVASLSVSGPGYAGRLLAPLALVRDGQALTFRDLDALLGDVRLRGAGEVFPDTSTARLADLRVTVDDVEARLEAPLLVAWDETGAWAEDLDVSVLGGRVRGRAAWNGAPHADLEADAFDLERWVAGIEGVVRASLHVDGERLRVRAEVPALEAGGWRGALALEAVQDEAGPLRVERLALTGPRGGVLEGEATLPWRLGTNGVRDVEGARPALGLRGTLGGVERFTGAVDGPVTLEVTGDESGLDAQVRIADVGLCDASDACDDVALALRVTPEAVTGRVALASDTFVQARGRLRIDRGFDWTRPDGIVDLLETATLDAELDALVRSWAPLARLVPGLRRLEGGTRVRLTARGPLRSPSLEGEASLAKVSVELDTDLAPFEQVDAHITFRDDVIRVDRLEGEMGYAPVALSGEVRLRAAGLPTVDLTLQGRNTQLIRTDWFRMRIDVDAHVTGPLDGMHVAGEGRIVDTIYREPVSLTGASGVGETAELVLFTIDDAPFDKVTFDLGVTADDTIRIRNNLVKADLSFTGRLKGSGARPALEGRATFRNAEITLPLTTLRDGTGEIEFLPGSPGRPRIQMTAHTRTKGYEMGMQISGRLPDVNLHVFTEPPLSDEDAMLMLATGSTGAELAEGGILGKGLASVASFFGGSLFTSRGEGAEPGRKSFFERFEISADLDGTDVRELDAEFEVERRFYLHVKRDRYEATDLGLIWRIRFR